MTALNNEAKNGSSRCTGTEFTATEQVVAPAERACPVVGGHELLGR